MRVLMVLAGLLLTLPMLALPLPAQAAEQREVRVFRVLDGDGLLVRTRYRSERVRLAGIDAPERRQAGGDFSVQVLEKMVSGQRVTILAVGENAAGETLVRMNLGDYDIALEMVRAGAAWAGPDGGPALREAEAQARQAGKGIWSASTPPVPPWQWRAEQE